MNTKLQKEIIIACVLGDGSLALAYPHGSASASLRFTHSPKQYDYLDWKINLLESLPIIKGKKFIVKDIITNFNDKSFKQRKASLSYTKYFRIVHKWLYKNNEKSIKTVLKYIKSPISLAIWFMDDGGILRKKKKHKNGDVYYLKPTMKLCTHSFGYDENILIQEYLKKQFNIESKILKDKSYYYLWFNVVESIKIWSIIKPYIMQLKSMQEKYDLCIQFFKDVE